MPSAELLRAATVARRYFLDDRTKVEIASELGISRFKVARLLELARTEGIVRIEVDQPAGVLVDLGTRLAERYGLREAWVVDASDAEPYGLLGRLGATMVTDLISPPGALGISWGRTMRSLVDALPALPDCPVVQIAGGLPDHVHDGAVDLIRRLCECTAGRAYALHAPLFVAEAATAARLRGEPQIARTLAMLRRLAIVVTGIGAWSARSPIASALTAADRRRLDRRGVVAELCGLFVTANGEVVDDLEDRGIGISAAQLRAAPRVVAVAGGQDKGDAVRAVLAAGLVSHLVTDRTVAEACLA